MIGVVLVAARAYSRTNTEQPARVYDVVLFLITRLRSTSYSCMAILQLLPPSRVGNVNRQRNRQRVGNAQPNGSPKTEQEHHTLHTPTVDLQYHVNTARKVNAAC